MPRWHLKRVARRGVVVGSTASGIMAARTLLSSTPRIRALMYHRIADVPGDPFSVSPDAFETHIRILAESRRAVSLEDVLNFLLGRAQLPRDACLVTIDDGLRSTLTEAFPILRRWGVPAVAFVSAGLIGSGHRYPEPYMDWDEVRALANSELVEIGSHAYTHRSLGMIPPDEARREIRKSKEHLEDKLGLPIRSFAYPYGTRSDFTPATERALAEAGFRIAFNSMHGSIRAGMNPISLPRVKVEGGDSVWMFHLLVRGAMDLWRVADHTLYRLQRSRIEVIGDSPRD